MLNLCKLNLSIFNTSFPTSTIYPKHDETHFKNSFNRKISILNLCKLKFTQVYSSVPLFWTCVNLRKLKFTQVELKFFCACKPISFISWKPIETYLKIIFAPKISTINLCKLEFTQVYPSLSLSWTCTNLHKLKFT